VHFTTAPGYTPNQYKAVQGMPTKTLRSLWFDAAVAYSLSPQAGYPIVTLGFGLADNQRMVVVRKNDGTSNDVNWGAETHISTIITIAASGTPRTRIIENQSEGGLMFGAQINLGASNLLIRGSQATHFMRAISGTGNITVGSGLAYQPTHLGLEGSNSSWSGAFTIQSQAFGIVGNSTVLGTGSNTVLSGGTLGWRSRYSSLTTVASAQPITVTGQGIVRQAGVQRVGAIYGDGGKIISKDKITFTNHTWFGARGDINGYLELRRQVISTGDPNNFNGNFDFRKVGPGLITLSNPGTGANANDWRQTIIEGGVLRQGHVNALPNRNIRFDGGILELGVSDFSRNLGTGGPKIRWFQNNDGGFSNFTGGTGLTRTVTLNNGVALTWGQLRFVQDTAALLLSSRYADAPIEFINPINLGISPTGSHREIRVERALSANAYGILSGNITSSGDSIQYDGNGNIIGVTTPSTGLLKTGHGLLRLTHTVPTGSIEAMLPYLYPLIIRGGALIKPDNQFSNVRLDSDSSGARGVLGVNQGYGASLGTGFGQIQWTNSGGFAGYLPNWSPTQLVMSLVVIGDLMISSIRE